jgi:hypothetical protein
MEFSRWDTCTCRPYMHSEWVRLWDNSWVVSFCRCTHAHVLLALFPHVHVIVCGSVLTSISICGCEVINSFSETVWIKHVILNWQFFA